MAGRREAVNNLYLAVEGLNELWQQREAVIALHERLGGGLCGECDVLWPCDTLAALGIRSEGDWWRRNSPPTVADHWLDLIRREAAI